MSNTEGISGLVLITAPDGKVVYCGPGMEAQLGWSENEVLAAGLQMLFSSPEESAAVLSGKGAAVRRITARRKNGAELPCDLRSWPLADPGGTAFGILHVLRPGASVESAAPAPAELPVQGRDWHRFAHKLNNVFASIHSNLDLALLNEVPEDVKPFLVQAQESVRRGARMVNEVRAQTAKAEMTDRAGAAPAKSGEGSERLLIAEDDKSIRTLIRAVLGYRGYTVVEASDGNEAISKVEQDGPFDLVILDMDMPEMEAQKALEHIRARHPDMLALGLSGLAPDEEAEEEEAPGRFDACLSKPFVNADLLSKVRQVLDKKGG